MTAREKETRYWEKRRLADKRRSINRAERNINREIKRMYQAAIKEIRADIENLYQSFARQEGITLLEAKKRLSKADFQEIDFDRMVQETAKEWKQLKTEEFPDDIAAAIEKKLKEQERHLKELSRRGYLTHLELMEAQIERTALEVGNEQQVNLYQLLDKEYRDGYFRGIFNQQQWLGVGKDFVSPNSAAVKKAVMQSWSNDHFSDRIWGGVKKLSQELKENLTIGLIRGEGVEEMTRRLTRRVEVSAANARRLVRTESAYIHEKATRDAFEECGITRYRFLATLDRRTSKICQEMDGKDFAIGEAQAGKNYPPMHPNCRSTVVPFNQEVTERAARTASGKYYTVPSNMTYQEWYHGLSETEKGKMALKNRQDRNKKADQEQHERYKKVLGAAAGSFRNFIAKKYEDPEGYERLKQQYHETNYINQFKQRLAGGKVNTRIQKAKQLEHTQGTKSLRNRMKQAMESQRDPTIHREKKKTPQSYLYRHVDAQKLVDQYAGKGLITYRMKSGTVQEWITVDRPVGRCYNQGTRRYEESRRICIMYHEKKGTHVYPVKER